MSLNLNKKLRTKARMATALDESLGKEEYLQTSIPALNLICSGSLLGGIDRGVTTIAGNSASYKTILTLHIIKDFIDTHEDQGLPYSVQFFDTEDGTNADTWLSMGIDPEKVDITRVYSLDELTRQMLLLAEKIKDSGMEEIPMMIVVDSIGQIDTATTSAKLLKEGQSEDMGRRAKAMNQFVRTVSSNFGPMNAYVILINQIYESMDQYSPPELRGGKGVKYTSQTVLITNQVKADDKDDFRVRIRLNKSRRVRSNAFVDLDVDFENGINYSSYIVDIANEIGFITHNSAGWYKVLKEQTEDGELIYDEENKVRAKSMNDEEINEVFLSNPLFNDMVERHFAFSAELNEDNLQRRKGMQSNLRELARLRKEEKSKKQKVQAKTIKKVIESKD